MKVLFIIIAIFLFCLPVSADTYFSPVRELDKEVNTDSLFYNEQIFLKDCMFLNSIPSFSLASEDNNQEPSGENAESGKKHIRIFLHITFTYLLPVSYFSLSLILKEFVYTETRNDNPMVYINPVVSSIVTFGAAGLFTGLVAGIILAGGDSFMDDFVYSTIVGLLAGIAGMLVGGIYAMLDYDSIITNDLFYYGGPVLFLFIPVVDIIRILSED